MSVYGLNKAKGNMYDWIDATWNPIKGECSHNCHYCYMKRWGKQKPIRLFQKELMADLGKNNLIFVGSSCDMFAEDIPMEWISSVFNHCNLFKDNRYLFQTKNPERLYGIRTLLPSNSIIGTTIESNKTFNEMGNTPSPITRLKWIRMIKYFGLETIITVEPVMDFDTFLFAGILIAANPNWINIGANTSYNIKLKEPEKDKIIKLLELLNRYKMEVKIKPNLKRLMK